MIRGRRARLRPLNGRPRPKPQSNGRKRRKRDAKGRFLPAKGRDPFREARASRGFFGMSGVRGPSGPMGRPSRLERLGDRRLRGAPRKRPNGKPTLTRAQAMALAKRVTRQMHEERGPVFSAASRDRYERAARKKKRGPLLAEMAKRSRKMRKQAGKCESSRAATRPTDTRSLLRPQRLDSLGYSRRRARKGAQ